MHTTIATTALLASVLAGCTSGADAAKDEPDEYGAQDVCHQFIEERLKSPSSADYSEEETTGVGKVFTVRGQLDSDNSFGASIRNDFVCKVRYVGDGHWRLVNLKGLLN